MSFQSSSPGPRVLYSRPSAADPPPPPTDMDVTRHPRFNDVCQRLNTSPETAARAWALWLKSSQYLCKDDLGELAPWFACVLYIADHNQLGGKAVKRVKGAGGVGATAATCISMPGLLQTSGLSPLRFFERLEDFSRQAVLDTDEEPDFGPPDDSKPVPTSVRQHASMMMQRLQVTTVLRKKFGAIFDDVFPPSPLTPVAATKSDADTTAAAMAAMAGLSLNPFGLSLFHTWFS